MRDIAMGWQRRPTPELLVYAGYDKVFGDWLPCPMFWPVVTDTEAKFVYVLRKKYLTANEAYVYGNRFIDRWNRIKGHDTSGDQLQAGSMLSGVGVDRRPGRGNPGNTGV